MPEKAAIRTNNYAVIPVSTILAASTMVLLFLKAFEVISIPWIIVFAPMAIWLGIVVSAGLVFVVVISFMSLLQIWR